MTCTLHRFPADDAMFARLTERQRLAELAAFWAAEVAYARAAIRHEDHYSDDDLRGFCAVLRTRWGDATDYLRAGQVLDAIELRERQRAHEAAKAAAETPADVARRFAHRWPEIVSWGAFVAVAMLSATGWLA